ncbi:MAG: hypothetical protein ABIT37_16060, partial [Luteolibacter sp.]
MPRTLGTENNAQALRGERKGKKAQSRKEWEPALTAWIFRAPLFTRQRHWARKVAHKVLSREWGR